MRISVSLNPFRKFIEETVISFFVYFFPILYIFGGHVSIHNIVFFWLFFLKDRA